MDFRLSVFSQRGCSNNPYLNEVGSFANLTKQPNQSPFFLFVVFLKQENTTVPLRQFGWMSSRTSYRRCRRGRLRKTRRGGCPMAAPHWATGSSLSGTTWCPLWSRCSRPQSGHAHRGTSVSDWAKRGKTLPIRAARLSCFGSRRECGRESGESFLSHTKPPTCSQTSPVHVGIFSSTILHARSIYVAANYRRSSAAAANYFKSLASVLEKTPSTHPHTSTTHTHTPPGHWWVGWWGGWGCLFGFCLPVRSSPDSNKKQLHTHTHNSVLVMQGRRY